MLYREHMEDIWSPEYRVVTWSMKLYWTFGYSNKINQLKETTYSLWQEITECLERAWQNTDRAAKWLSEQACSLTTLSSKLFKCYSTWISRFLLVPPITTRTWTRNSILTKLFMLGTCTGPNTCNKLQSAELQNQPRVFGQTVQYCSYTTAREEGWIPERHSPRCRRAPRCHPACGPWRWRVCLGAWRAACGPDPACLWP